MPTLTTTTSGPPSSTTTAPEDHLGDPLFSTGQHRMDSELPQKVLEQSNAHPDNLWDLVNGGSQDLTAPGSGKPKAWRRGLQIDGDRVTVNDGSVLPEVDTVQEYKERLVADFDFLGAKTAFLDAGGESVFVGAVRRRYPKHPLGPDNLEELARRIWSYATLGQDRDGSTDIAELQGLLYQLDGRVKESSDTNTPMSSETMALGDTEVPLGDDLHGRATTLTTRHLLHQFMEVDPDLTMVVLDVSHSMADERKHLADILHLTQPKGDVTISTFGHHTFDTKFKWDDDVQGAHATEWHAMKDQLESLSEEVRRTKKATEDAENGTDDYDRARTAWFALRDRKTQLEKDMAAFYQKHKSLDRMTASEANTSLQNASGDPLYREPPIQEPLESGFKAALDTLDQMPPTSVETRLLVIYTDEGDIEGSLLNPLKDRARKMNVQVKVCYSLQRDDQSVSYVVFDLDEIQTSDIKQGGLSWKRVQERLGKSEQTW